MTTTVCTCCHDRPVQDRFVCVDCIDTLHGDLAALPGDVHELTVELTRQARKGRGRGGRSADNPLPLNLAASRILTELRTLLVSEIRELTFGDMDRQPGGTWEAMCLWLTQAEQSIALREGGGEFCRELSRLRGKARRLVDTPPERVYVGQCDCLTTPPLYAPRDQAVVRCRTCGADWNVQDRLDQLEQECRDFRLTAREVELATGGRIKASRVRKWKERGQVDIDTEGRIRFGDALGLEARRATA